MSKEKGLTLRIVEQRNIDRLINHSGLVLEKVRHGDLAATD